MSDALSRPQPAGQTHKRPVSTFALSRTTLNFWLDVTLLLLLVALLWTACVIRFAFPPGPRASGWMLWGRSYSQWCDIRFTVLCTFVFAVLIHIMLHWTWICGVVTSRFMGRRDGKKILLEDGARTIYGVSLLIGLLTTMGIGLAAANLFVQAP